MCFSQLLVRALFPLFHPFFPCTISAPFIVCSRLYFKLCVCVWGGGGSIHPNTSIISMIYDSICVQGAKCLLLSLMESQQGVCSCSRLLGSQSHYWGFAQKSLESKVRRSLVLVDVWMQIMSVLWAHVYTSHLGQDRRWKWKMEKINYWRFCSLCSFFFELLAAWPWGSVTEKSNISSYSPFYAFMKNNSSS